MLLVISSNTQIIEYLKLQSSVIQQIYFVTRTLFY